MDDSASLAKAVLGIMISCLHEVPKFITKLLPISKLSSRFLYEQIEPTVKSMSK